MATNRVGDMTIEELNALIEDVLERRLQGLHRPHNARTTLELLDFIDQHRIKLPQGAKSSLELLREDRDA